MNHWPKIVSIVELDPQALLTFVIHIAKKTLLYSLSCQVTRGPLVYYNFPVCTY